MPIADRGVKKPAMVAVVAWTGAIAVWFFFVRVPPVSAEYLQGEWIQDPNFLQHAGQDLDAQKGEIDHWENYEFLFKGQRLTGWRNVFDGAKNMTGWAEGRGVSFESDYTLAPASKTMILRFSDHAKAATEAQITRDRQGVLMTLGDRRLRLVKSPAPNLRAREIIPSK